MRNHALAFTVYMSALGLAACAHVQESGTERGSCRADGCNSGLICLSETCVKPPATCEVAATHLGELLPDKPRDTLAAGCNGRHLDAIALECLARAKTGDDAARCPGATDEDHEAFWTVPSCRELVVHATTVYHVEKVDEKQLAQGVDSCEQQHLTKKQLRCYQAATSPDQFSACAAAPEAPEAAAAPPNDGPVGVAECDQYLERMRACASKMPNEATKPVDEAMAKMTRAWRDAASTPEGRTALAAGCLQAINAAEEAYKSMGCSFKDDPGPAPAAPAKPKKPTPKAKAK